MMHDLKIGIKVMRYAYGIKMNCISAGLFALAGLLYIVEGKSGNNGLVGSYFWICIGMIPVQLIQSLNAANFVQSSPIKKKMQTSIPVMLSLASMMAMYLAEVLLYGIMVWANPGRAAEISGSLVLMAILGALLLLYLGACYKCFVVATFCLISLLVFWMWGVINGVLVPKAMFGSWNISFGLAVLMGFGILIAGSAAEYLLTLLLYKKPVAKMAQAAPLRKEL